MNLRHLLVDVRAILPGLSHSGARARAALGPFDAGAETFVIRIEVEKKLV